MRGLRVSDAERERAAAGLSRAWCAGYLSLETFSARVDAAYEARSRDELRRLFEDVPLGLLGAARSTWERVLALLRRRPAVESLDRVTTLHLPNESGDANPIAIGRAVDSDLRLVDETVSRHHAVLVPDGEAWVVLDAGSTNGVYLNGRRVWRAEIRKGDVLDLGYERVRLADDASR